MVKKTTAKKTPRRSSPANAANPIGRPLFRFLANLAKHNEREWFQANKPRYEEEVRGPAMEFIASFGRPLERISRHYEADPRPVGGSLFRIHRDTRFSKDKTPYKNFVGIQFRHEACRDVHTPGFYLHLEPKRSFVGVGLWHPGTPDALAVRKAIVADPGAWKRAARRKAFVSEFTLDGESLERPPRGFDPEHPYLEDLKRKDFVAVHGLTDAEVTAAEFPARFAKYCKTGGPFVAFLCGAPGLAF